MNKFLIAVALFLTTVTSAHAWGPREQGALAGIAATLLWQHVHGHAHTQQQPVYIPQQQPQIIVPQHYPQHYPQQPRVIIQQPQPQVIIIQQGGHVHRRGHYNGGHYDGYYQQPDPNVYNPQMR